MALLILILICTVVFVLSVSSPRCCSSAPASPVPSSYPTLGSVGLWINTVCPGTTTTLNFDGTTTFTECSGHGTCVSSLNECSCSGRYTGFSCSDIDNTMGLSSGARALIIVFSVLGTVGLGAALCWWFSRGMDRRSPMAGAGYGHHLDADGGDGGDNERSGRGRPSVGQRPPMGRI